MAKRFLLFFSILCIMGCVTTKPYQGSPKVGKAIMSSELLNQHFKGLIVKDLINKKTVFSLNENKLFNPASNTKLLTFYVSDLILPDSIPSIKYCTVNDTLYFKGMADPTLLHPGFTAQPTIQLLNSSSNTLAYANSIFEDKKYGPGWAWDDYPYYFQPEKSMLPIYGNCLWVKKDSLDITYRIFPKPLAQNLTIHHLPNHKFEIQRQESRNHFILTYDSLPTEIDKCMPFIYSDTLAINLLKDTLKKDIYHKASPLQCEPAMLYSHPKDSLFKKLLVESDNFIAEQLLLSSGAYLYDTLSSTKTIEFAFDNFLRDWKDSIRWVDGSGLSRYNAMPPALMIDILERIYHKNQWKRITHLFPDGGKEGTLDNFLYDDAPFVYAKTGSMTGVYNLSGYIVSDRGNILAFSFMNNNLQCSFTNLKVEIERILRIIKEQY